MQDFEGGAPPRRWAATHSRYRPKVNSRPKPPLGMGSFVDFPETRPRHPTILAGHGGSFLTFSPDASPSPPFVRFAAKPNGAWGHSLEKPLGRPPFPVAAPKGGGRLSIPHGHPTPHDNRCRTSACPPPACFTLPFVRVSYHKFAVLSSEINGAAAGRSSVDNAVASGPRRRRRAVEAHRGASRPPAARRAAERDRAALRGAAAIEPGVGRRDSRLRRARGAALNADAPHSLKADPAARSCRPRAAPPCARVSRTRASNRAGVSTIAAAA